MFNKDRGGRKMKKVLVLLLSVAMMIFAVACGGKSETTTKTNGTESSTTQTQENDSLMGSSSAKVKFKVGTTTAPTGHYVKGLEKLQELLEEYSDGEMTVDIYPNSQLGNERDMMENVGMGVQDMTLISTGPIPNFAPDYAVLDLPYLFETEQDAYEVLDGPIGTSLLQQLTQHNIIGLGFYENGFRDLTNNSKEILLPEDVKNMKIRTMENNVHMAAFKALGATPTPMAWSEIFTALQQGTVDGQENPLAIIETSKIYEVQKYVSLTDTFYSPCVLMISKTVYDGLTADQQAILNKAAEEAKVWQREYSLNYNKEAIETLEAAGVTVSKVDKSLWREAVSSVYEEASSLGLNEELVDKLTK